MVDIRSSGLSLTASLKAAQISRNLLLLQSTAQTVTTRVLIQSALRRYLNGNNTEANWSAAGADLQAALSGGTILLIQAKIFPPSGDGPAGSHSLLNITSSDPRALSTLPTANNDGPVYPPVLYPNLTYVNLDDAGLAAGSVASVFDNRTIDQNSTLLLGPLLLNSTAALLSLTVPIFNNTHVSDILGYMTVVADARLIAAVIASPEGLDSSGETLMLGPDTPENRFPSAFHSSSNTIVSINDTAVRDLQVRFVWSPSNVDSLRSRHTAHLFGKPNDPFPLRSFPAVFDAFTRKSDAPHHAGSLLSSTNEEGYSVAVGYARVFTALCDWVLVIEQDHYEAVAPLRRLRNILLACVFGTLGLILLLVFPIAHFSVRPIRRLRQATKESIEPPGFETEHPSSPSSRSGEIATGDRLPAGDEKNLSATATEKYRWLRSLAAPWRFFRPARNRNHGGGLDARAGTTEGRAIRVPRKVQDRKHFVHDELTELTQTFNEMSDELMLRYERLEDRVRERTQELELSKKAAEAANESKTLFIANISHEFRTPLNAILGLTAVCMEEKDLGKVKQSLEIVYRSGDLLLHLLTDLLTFSKNQIGQQLTLDEREFRLGEIGLQISSIFDKQASDGQIKLTTTYAPAEGDLSEVLLGPLNPTDVYVWGDQNRILQVIINLVSNSLKFTPAGQSVHFRVRCLGDAETDSSSRKASNLNHHHHQSSSHSRPRISPSHSSTSEANSNAMSTALSINPMETGPLARIHSQDRSPSPLIFSRTMMFDFEVEDTGPGIPEHLQARIFEPFVQGDLGLSKKYGGTGLGLSICAQLAKLMGGDITLRSSVGVGSTFNMRIPLKVRPTRPESNASNANSASKLHPRSASTNVTTPLSDGTVAAGVPFPVRSNSRTSPTINATNAGIKPEASHEPTSAVGAIANTDGAQSHVATTPRLVGLSQPFFTAGPMNGTTPVQGLTEPGQPNERIRILVAEDNIVNQEVVLRMLKLEAIYGTLIWYTSLGGPI